MRLFRALLVLLTAAGSVSVLGAFLSGWHWIFDLAGQFLLPALWGLVLAALGWIGLMLAAPSTRRSRGWPSLAAMALLASFYVLQGPPELAPPQSANSYSLYQHNVWVEVSDPNAELEAIRSADTDFVALVEVWPDLYTPHLERLKETWPYAVTGDVPPAVYTRMMLLSKYPVLSSKILFPHGTPSLLHARVQLPEGELTVLVVHFTRPWPFREPMDQMQQLEGLESILEEVDGPAVMVGDFNSAAWGRLSRRLQARHDFHIVNNPRLGTWPALLTDGLKTGGPPWPGFAGIPIDLAFCRGGLSCGAHTTLPANGSDHYAARFDLVMPETGPAEPR